MAFIVPQMHPGAGAKDGLFVLAYALRDADEISKEDRQALTALLEWFEEHLTVPERFNRSSSKGYYRRSSKVIAWFRDTAEKQISGMWRTGTSS